MKNTQFLEQLERETQERLSVFSRSDVALAKKAELGRPLTESELEWLEIETNLHELVELYVLEAMINTPEIFLDDSTPKPCEFVPDFADYEDGYYEWVEGPCYHCNEEGCTLRSEDQGGDVFDDGIQVPF